MNILKNNNFFSKIKYLTYFVTRAFLLSIFCSLLLIIVLVGIYFGDFFLNVKSGNYKNPLFNGFIIVSQSMVPTINIDDAILIKREDNDSYKVGDIISFSSSDDNYKGLTVTHRIVSKNKNDFNNSSYITKGDNNPIQDRNSVMTSDIYGKVMFIIPKFGQLQKFLSKPSNFIICILVPVLIVLVYDGFRIALAIKNRVRN